jgi:hypothetical protein
MLVMPEIVGGNTAQLEKRKLYLCASTILRINMAGELTVQQPVDCWKQ